MASSSVADIANPTLADATLGIIIVGIIVLVGYFILNRTKLFTSDGATGKPVSVKPFKVTSVSDIIEKIKDILFNPVECFQRSRQDDIKDVFTYLVLITLIPVIIMGIGSAFYVAVAHQPALIAFGTVFAAFIAILALVIIFGIWTHIWVRILGGQQTIKTTIIAIAYSATPYILLFWAGPVSIIGGIYGFFLSFLGIRELQAMSGGKAITTIILSCVTLAIVLLILSVTFAILAFLSQGAKPL
jgi:hypothetical protein